MDMDQTGKASIGRDGSAALAGANAMPAPGNGRAGTGADAAHWVNARSAASRSSFFWAMRLLPKHRRQAMFLPLDGVARYLEMSTVHLAPRIAPAEPKPDGDR